MFNKDIAAAPQWLHGAYANDWADWIRESLPDGPEKAGLLAWLEERAVDLTGGLPDVKRLPFEEGMPTPDKVKAMGAWLRSNSDLYANVYVVLYHATDPALPILEQGLLPTSTARRRSYQSQSGFVYLANTPERAKNFGDIGNGCQSAVYAVRVRVRDLKADIDQLNNQRAVGKDVGNSLAESIVYGGGARVKGAVHPYAIRRITLEAPRLTHAEIVAAVASIELPQPRKERSSSW